MIHQKRSNVTLPEWLWFFLLLPIVLIVALLYRRQRLPVLRRVAQRYVEPDSIPLDMGAAEAVKIAQRADDGYAASEELTTAAGLASSEGPGAIDTRSTGELLLEEQPPVESVFAGEADDLKIIEGIGPAISGILRENDIRTFRQLAQAPRERLVEILTRANLSRLADPTTWPEQARLAADGQWDELTSLQENLKAGRRRAA